MVLASYRALVTACDKYSSVWSGLSGFANNYAKFKASIQTIDDSVNEQVQLSGAAGQKAKRRAVLVDQALIIAGAVSSFAVDQGNSETASRVAYTREDLAEGRDRRAAERCETIHIIATRAGTGLAGYLADAQVEMDALKAACLAFRTSLAKPSKVRKAIKLLKRKIEEATATASAVLDEHLDKLMLQYRTKAPEFFAAYSSARALRDSSEAQQTPTPAA